MSVSPLGVGISLFKSIIGSGVLAMPYCVMQAGAPFALGTLALIWCVTVYTSLQLYWSVRHIHKARCTLMKRKYASTDPLLQSEPMWSPAAQTPDAEMIKAVTRFENAEEEDGDHVVSFVHLVEAAFGRTGRYVALATVVPGQIIVGTSYLVFVIQNTARALGLEQHMVGVTAVVFLLQCALCSPKSSSYLAYTSVFGNVAFATGLLTILYHAVFVHGLTVNPVYDDNPSITRTGQLEAFGILVVSYSFGPESLGVLASANTRARHMFGRLIVLVLFVCLIVFSSFALLVFMSYGSETSSIVFDVLPKSASLTTVKLAMSMMLCCNYPLTMFAVFHIQETTWLADDFGGITLRLVSRWAIVALTCVLAFSAGDTFAAVNAVDGGLTAFIAFVIPPMCYWKMLGHKHFGPLEKALNVTIIVLGFIGGTVSAATGLLDIGMSSK
eukprot:PhM_4_TR9414/c0_g1_i1/m.54371/K14209/SLC36A, PAT; solute carrier family 36 (proton-coupled amino acid transporter)